MQELWLIVSVVTLNFVITLKYVVFKLNLQKSHACVAWWCRGRSRVSVARASACDG